MRKFAMFGLATIVLATWASDASAFGFRKKKKDQCNSAPVQQTSCCGSAGMGGYGNSGYAYGNSGYSPYTMGNSGYSPYTMGNSGATGNYYSPYNTFPTNPVVGGQFAVPGSGGQYIVPASGGQYVVPGGGQYIVSAGGVPTPMPSNR